MAAKKLRVYVRWSRAGDHELQFCECGCGEKFSASQIIAVPAQSEDHPHDFIYAGHLVAVHQVIVGHS